MTDKTTKPPERYTSYHHPEKTFSILNTARKYSSDQMCEGAILGITFEYNGLSYTLDFKPNPISDTILYENGPMTKHVNPDSGGEHDEVAQKIIATFQRDTLESFIKTYEIEGKTLEWILDHQREWKYKLTAEHLEKYAGAFSFGFIYRKIPWCIYEYTNNAKSAHTGNAEGFYIETTPGILLDVTPYAPSTPGAQHWTELLLQTYDMENIVLGPYATMSELLDHIKYEKKTLREIFNTEYDDATTLCGCFGV